MPFYPYRAQCHTRGHSYLEQRKGDGDRKQLYVTAVSIVTGNNNSSISQRNNKVIVPLGPKEPVHSNRSQKR